MCLLVFSINDTENFYTTVFKCVTSAYPELWESTGKKSSEYELK